MFSKLLEVTPPQTNNNNQKRRKFKPVRTTQLLLMVLGAKRRRIKRKTSRNKSPQWRRKRSSIKRRKSRKFSSRLVSITIPISPHKTKILSPGRKFCKLNNPNSTMRENSKGILVTLVHLMREMARILKWTENNKNYRNIWEKLWRKQS